VRQGTRRILEDSGRIEVVAEAADGEQALAASSTTTPTSRSSTSACPAQRHRGHPPHQGQPHPHVSVLVLTVHDDDQYVFALLEAGAAGYLLKDVEGHELVHAVEAVHAGESVLHPAITHKVLTRLARGEHPTLRRRSADRARARGARARRHGGCPTRRSPRARLERADRRGAPEPGVPQARGRLAHRSGAPRPAPRLVRPRRPGGPP
jgi:DNA-binding NarL/FixJ family response regulator